MVKKIAIIAAATVLAASCSSPVGPSEKPFTVPEIREWTPAAGARKVGKNPRIRYVDDSSLAREEYRLEITRCGIKAYASDVRGRTWAESTVRQLAARYDGKVPCGTIRDWPEYEMRGFLLDIARRYFPLEWLYRYIDEMTYYKLNTLHLHLCDNGGYREYDNVWENVPGFFRLQSDLFPTLASPGESYTKQEYIDLQKYAESKGVEIISEFDSPAHSLSYARCRPEITSTIRPDHLDLCNPLTFSMLDSLYTEFLGGDDPVIRGLRFHAGLDEYRTKDPEVMEQFRVYTNHFLELTESFGKQACSWGALTDMAGETPVDGHGRIVWAWQNKAADPDSMMALGFDLLCVPDYLMYIVPTAGFYNEYLDRQKIYDTWTPAHVGTVVYEENHPKIKGGMFAEWNDFTTHEYTMEDVHDRVYPAMQVVAAKTWSGTHTSFTFEQFDEGSQIFVTYPH